MSLFENKYKIIEKLGSGTGGFVFKAKHVLKNELCAIKIEINFMGEPNIQFIIDLQEKHFFNNATEKIDNIVELLQYHLSGNDIPENISKVVYKFDTDSGRWKLNMITANDKKFVSTEKGWKIST